MSERLQWAIIAGLIGGFAAGTLHTCISFWWHMKRRRSSVDGTRGLKGVFKEHP